MKRFTIAARLWAPSLALGVCLVLAGGGTAVRTIKLLEEARIAQTSQQLKLSQAAQATGLAEAQGVRQLAALALPEDQRAAQAADIQQAQQRLQQLQASLREHVQASDEKTALDTAGQKQAAFQAALAQGPEAAKAALPGWLAAQADFAKLQEAKGDALREQVAKDRMRTVWSVTGLMAVIVLVVSISTAFLVRTICGPLALLRDVANRVGRGDLSVQIARGRNDEIGDVLHSVEEMRNALRSVVGEVRQSADSVRVASTEVAVGNADLSQRTEQTASRLQQTASAMEELTGTVTHSADAARQAHTLAHGAAQVAGRGGEVVAQVVQTMDEISTSSRRIADITGVIDGIAFQTNILALNAAVEAARAGEQGRGFAVVAGEVRILAQRSAAAAKEIKTLIGSSVERVETGSRLVGAAGQTMDEIVASVQRVSQMIGEISLASGEQSQGLGHVNGAVSELDRMTQQNAALVEQSAAAAESLKQQAARLTQVVDAFKLENA